MSYTNFSGGVIPLKAFLLAKRRLEFTGTDGREVDMAQVQIADFSIDPNWDGLTAKTLQVSAAVFRDLPECPCLVDVEIGMQLGARGTPKALITHVAFLDKMVVPDFKGAAVK